MDQPRALIIVDVQPTFTEGGALGVDGGDACAERIADFVTEHADDYEFIVTTQDWHIDPGAHFSDNPDFVDSWPPHGVAGTPEAELHDAVASLPFDDSVKKGEYAAAYSGFEGKNADGETLEQLLRDHEIGGVDVVGIAESHCVKETALDALKAGFVTRVFSDLTVPVSEELGVEARIEMDEAGVEQISSAEAFGFYDGDEDDVPLIADEWDSYAASRGDDDGYESTDEFSSDDTYGFDDYDFDENDEAGAADYEDDELAGPNDAGYIRVAPESDEYGDESGSEFAGANAAAESEEARVEALLREEGLEDIDLAEFGIDDDLELDDEEFDFSAEVDETDFNFDDLR